MKRPGRGPHGRTLLWAALVSAVLSAGIALYLRSDLLAGGGRPGVEDLPLLEYPSPRASGDVFAVVMTGDAGWSPIAGSLARHLARHGVPAVGWNSLRYYWHPRTPQEAAEDLQRVMDAYAARWGRRRVLLVGFSFGADALPFLVNRLPADERARVAGVALLSFGRDAAFEIHARDWLGYRPTTPFATVPEARRLTGIPVLCVYGIGDSVTRVGCPLLRDDGAVVRQLPGGHHFGGDYARVDSLVLPVHKPLEGWPMAATHR